MCSQRGKHLRAISVGYLIFLLFIVFSSGSKYIFVISISGLKFFRQQSRIWEIVWKFMILQKFWQVILVRFFEANIKSNLLKETYFYRLKSLLLNLALNELWKGSKSKNSRVGYWQSSLKKIQRLQILMNIDILHNWKAK